MPTEANFEFNHTTDTIEVPDEPGLVVSIDTDWAPDYMLGQTLALLEEYGVSATWFITHDTPVLDQIRESAVEHELGIHPNFQENSTHGDRPADILDNLTGIVPEAVSVRAHCLDIPDRALELIATDPTLEVDSSLFVPGEPGIQPVREEYRGNPIPRVPVYWEDWHAMTSEDPRWSLKKHLDLPGLQVLLFHPIHVFLNSASLKPYNELKAHGDSVDEVTEEQAESFRTDGEGTRSFFESVLSYLSDQGGGTTIQSLVGDR